MPLLRRGDEFSLLATARFVITPMSIVRSHWGIVLDALFSHLKGMSWRLLELWGLRAVTPMLGSLALRDSGGFSLDIALGAVCPG